MWLLLLVDHFWLIFGIINVEIWQWNLNYFFELVIENSSTLPFSKECVKFELGFSSPIKLKYGSSAWFSFPDVVLCVHQKKQN